MARRTEARADFDMALGLFAELLSDKLEGVSFDDGFDPQVFLLETIPSMVDAIEVDLRAEIATMVEERDPNNASRLRGVF